MHRFASLNFLNIITKLIKFSIFFDLIKAIIRIKATVHNLKCYKMKGLTITMIQ